MVFGEKGAADLGMDSRTACFIDPFFRLFIVTWLPAMY